MSLWYTTNLYSFSIEILDLTPLTNLHFYQTRVFGLTFFIPALPQIYPGNKTQRIKSFISFHLLLLFIYFNNNNSISSANFQNRILTYDFHTHRLTVLLFIYWYQHVELSFSLSLMCIYIYIYMSFGNFIEAYVWSLLGRKWIASISSDHMAVGSFLLGLIDRIIVSTHMLNKISKREYKATVDKPS